MRGGMNRLVTIVIPCKNEEHYIGNILSDLIFQVYSHLYKSELSAFP